MRYSFMKLLLVCFPDLQFSMKRVYLSKITARCPHDLAEMPHPWFVKKVSSLSAGGYGKVV